MNTRDKKTEILEAASSCFARYGYEKTTLDDIGKIVGLNKASLYYYYKNKENIYTEVIFSEAAAFLEKVFKETEKVSNCKEKILTYISERLRYIRSAVNLNQLSMDSIQKLTPLFTQMYDRIVEKEIAYLSDTLLSCIKNNEIIACDTIRVAKSIITVTESIKNKSCNCIDHDGNSEVAHSAALDEVLFTISLMLDGLKRK